MPKRSNEFQHLIRRIYEATTTNGDAQVEESALLKEKNSDTKREVDILVSQAVAGHTIRIAIECRDHSRDQDITWIDSLIGKFSNLEVHKVIAISSSPYTQSARQKAIQHRIEPLSLAEAELTDWASQIGPAAIRFYAYDHNVCVIALRLSNSLQFKLEYSSDGILKNSEEGAAELADYFQAIWALRYAERYKAWNLEYVFDDANWQRLSNSKISSPRYAELHDPLNSPQRIGVEGKIEVDFDEIIWGVCTKLALSTSATQKYALGDKAVAIASANDYLGNKMHLTLVSDKSGKLLGSRLDRD